MLRMNLIRIHSGLGNQMFQYSLCLMLNTQTETFPYAEHDPSALERYFGIPIPYYPRKYLGFLHRVSDQLNNKYRILRAVKRILARTTDSLWDAYIHRFQEVSDRQDVPLSYLLHSDRLFLNGYWQTENYFQPVRDTVRSLFTFAHISVDEMGELVARVRAPQSVAIHIRRGDYVSTEKHRSIYGGICTDDYYLSAIERMKSRLSNPYFFIFSDEPALCRDLSFLKDIHHEIVEHRHPNQPLVDMYLMSLCRNIIIANSTFSWWAAYLGERTNTMIIAPSRWTNSVKELDASDTSSIVPGRWIRI